MAQRAHGTQVVGFGVVGTVFLQGVISKVDIVVGERRRVQFVRCGGETQVSFLEGIVVALVVH